MHFDITTEMIETTALMEVPDKDWLFIDANGHEHRWDGDKLPTLIEIIDQEHLDYPSETHHECRLCGERVNPRYILDNNRFRSFIPGMKHFFIDGIEVSQEEFIQAVNAL